MIVGVIALIAAFAVARIATTRYTGNSTVGNISGAAIAIAFLVGSLARPFQLTSTEMAGSSQVAASAGAGHDALAPAVASNVHDVTGGCRNLTAPPKSVGFGVLDAVVSGKVRSSGVAEGASVPGNVQLAALGWGADDDQRQLASGVCLLVDGRVASRATSLYGTGRPDVAAAFKTAALQGAGFKIIVPPNSLAKGRHRLSVAIASKDKTFTLARNTWDVVIR